MGPAHIEQFHYIKTAGYYRHKDGRRRCDHPQRAGAGDAPAPYYVLS